MWYTIILVTSHIVNNLIIIDVSLSNVQNGTGLPGHHKLHSVNVSATAPGPVPKCGLYMTIS